MSSVYVHMCFDGQEAPVTFTSDVIGSAPLHHDEANQHNDQDVSLIKLVIVKLCKIDLPWVLAVFVLILCLATPSCYVVRHECCLLFFGIFLLCPPLRAPPLFFA